MEFKDVMEILFNIFYLIFIWYIVYKMVKSFNVTDNNTVLKKLSIAAFALLALGDTGHVGFRVISYLNGGLAKNALLLGYGKMATALTITIFYALLVEIWRVGFNKEHSLFTTLLFACAIVRFIIVLLPGNQWGSSVVPFNWSMYRNIPLTILGLSVAIVFLKDGIKAKNNTFKWIGIMILISFAFYTPVILFASQMPMIGLLMIPKTVAYLVAAIIAYNGIFKMS